jgi:hypothetical protein
MGDTSERVIEAIEENRRRFEAFCFGLTGEQLDRPVPDSTWVVRDFAAHLATLDPPFTRWFDGLARGNAVLDGRIDADGAPFDIDQYNDAVVAERRSWPLSKVFEEAAENRRALVAALRALDDEQASRPMHFAGDNKRGPGTIPLNLFLAGWAQHDPIHVADMLKALPELADDADIRAWLDNPFVGGYQKAMAGPPRR